MRAPVALRRTPFPGPVGAAVLLLYLVAALASPAFLQR